MNHFKKDFLSSIIVFLVALPLCMGIAIASDVPISYGILSGIIGGIIVGFITGSPLQVSGPAAGIVMIVYEIVQSHGVIGLGIATFFAGLMQITFSLLKLGPYFRGISPSVINGMLSGVGALIFGSQIHVMLDDAPKTSAVENYTTIPTTFMNIVTEMNIGHIEALAIGTGTILIMVFWSKLGKKLKLIPGALVAIIFMTIVSYATGMAVDRVMIDTSLTQMFTDNLIFNHGSYFSFELIGLAIPLAIVATAETLLCTTAVAKLRPDVEVGYNKELFAQGIGNTLCGVFGALPLTGVIVRSSANIDAGAETKNSTIMHGLLLVIFIGLFSSVLRTIPTSALAAILVLTGVKLLNIKGLIKSFKADKIEGAIWFVTTVSIVATDLLTGIIFGFVLSLFKLLWKLNKIEIKVSSNENDKTVICLDGKASFLNLAKIAKSIEVKSKDKNDIKLDLKSLVYKDEAFDEYLENLRQTFIHRGLKFEILNQH